ncbi:MAG TPA: HAMP domain-containing sensor histidine kinase [Gaiellaceae bacterium]|nr:HAMP domain-containing sensor histidine kinase [Gaiellaceae bacterium]
MVLRTSSHGSTEHGPRLVLRFALYAGAVLLAAGLAIAWLVNREVANRAQHTLESQAQAVVAANLNEQLRPSDFRAPATRARRETLDRLFRQSILIPGVVGGRLVGPNGTITYAANHLLIGTKVSHPAELQKVLSGSIQRGVAHTQTWRGQKNLKVLRVVVPVRLKGRPRPIGAVELDQDYRAVAVTVGDARGRLALILTLALLALYISLFPILHRVTRQLESRNRRLREDAAERERLLGAEREARDEAESARQLLAAQNERLRELDALKDEFVSLVSHELRTPLTSIRGYLELLQEDGELTEEQQRYVGVVDRNSARLLDLVSDLLFLAQVDAGKLAFELRPVELDLVVDECVEASQPAAAAKGIELASRTERLPAPLQGDPARLAQVLDNLVSNALKFTPAGGRVEVRLSAVRGVAVIEVEDTGLGLPEDEQEQLFERFFRSSRASENAIPGTGLGLTIAKTIVERHGGRIQLESAVDVGTTVRVELPLSLSESGRSPDELAA